MTRITVFPSDTKPGRHHAAITLAAAGPNEPTEFVTVTAFETPGAAFDAALAVLNAGTRPGTVDVDIVNAAPKTRKKTAATRGPRRRPTAAALDDEPGPATTTPQFGEPAIVTDPADPADPDVVAAARAGDPDLDF